MKTIYGLVFLSLLSLCLVGTETPQKDTQKAQQQGYQESSEGGQITDLMPDDYDDLQLAQDYGEEQGHIYARVYRLASCVESCGEDCDDRYETRRYQDVCRYGCTRGCFYGANP